MSVTINPLLPLGSESLKLGPSRIRAIAEAVLKILGFTGATTETFVAPFTSLDGTGLLTVTGDPIADLGIATAQFVGRKVLGATLTSADAITYTGTTSPDITAYQLNATYVLNNIGPANAGAIVVKLGSAPSVPLVRRDGSTPAAGTMYNGAMFLAVYDGAKLRIMDFIGGTLTEPLVLAADPTVALGAATKQYVDGLVGSQTGVPARTFVPADKALNLTDQSIVTAAITVPNDGYNYLLFVSYLLWVDNDTPNANQPYAASWITDGSTQWGTAMQYGPQGSGSHLWCALVASGYSPVVYAPGSTVTVDLRAERIDDVTVTARTALPVNGTIGSHIDVSLIRSHA